MTPRLMAGSALVNDMPNEVEFALLKQSVAAMERRNARLEQKLDEMATADAKRIRSAAVTLGAVVLSLVSYIWVQFTGWK